jgi:hypothetical protein
MGRVKVLLTPDHALLVGSVAVTFEDESVARVCQEKLGGRWFDGRQLSVELVLPPTGPSGDKDSSMRHDNFVTAPVDVVAGATAREECPLDVAAVEEVAQGVEDFLNSLL